MDVIVLLLSVLITLIFVTLFHKYTTLYKRIGELEEEFGRSTESLESRMRNSKDRIDYHAEDIRTLEKQMWQLMDLTGHAWIQPAGPKMVKVQLKGKKK